MRLCHQVAFLTSLLCDDSTRGTSDSRQSSPRVTLWLFLWICSDLRQQGRWNLVQAKHVSVPSLPAFTMTRGHGYTCLKLEIHSRSKKPASKRNYLASVASRKRNNVQWRQTLLRHKPDMSGWGAFTWSGSFKHVAEHCWGLHSACCGLL